MDDLFNMDLRKILIMILKGIVDYITAQTLNVDGGNWMS